MTSVASGIRSVSCAASAPDIASMIEQGDRESQQDAVRTSAGDDGSWMIAVADGTGGGINPEAAAPAAVAALPARIGSDEEMIDAFAAANRAVRRHGTEDSRARMGEDLDAGWTRDPDTTLVVAAWTPEGGLVAGWIGDSVVMIAPSGGNGWCCRPQLVESGAPLIGEFAAGSTASESLRSTIALLGDDLPGPETDEMVACGGVVVVMSDGAYDMHGQDAGLFRYRYLRDSAYEGSAPHRYADAALMDQFLPRAERHSASSAAAAVMRQARLAGMHDNTSVAVARIAPFTPNGTELV